MAKTLTAANSVITFIIPNLYASGFSLSGYAADDIFDTDPLESAEVSMGVDGTLSAGFVFVPVRQGYNLQANSPSIQYFDNWWSASQQARDAYPASGEIDLPAIKSRWRLRNGYLTSYPPVPNAGRILRPRKFMVTWNSVQVSSL